MRSKLAQRAAAFGVVAFSLLVTAASGCQQIIGIPDRAARENLECHDGECACVAGFGDCNGSLSDGCEVAVGTDQNNCGACGAVCANGTCTAGSCGCLAGFDDCDASPQNGCETELAVSPTSCGTCGHDCLGGTCDAALCGPVALADAASPGHVVVAGGFVYYADFDIVKGSFVRRVPVAGGAPETIVTIPPATPLRRLAVTSSFVAVFSDHQLYRIDLPSFTKTPLYSYAAGDIMDVRATDSTIYLVTGSSTTFSPQEIVSVDAASGASSSVTTDVSSQDAGLSLVKGVPYWIDSAGTISTLVNGMPAVWPPSPSPMFGLAANDEYLFAVVWPPSSNDFSLKRFRMSDLTAVETVMPASYKELAPVGSEVFWFDTDNQVVEWTETGTKILGKNVVTFDVTGIGVDEVAVYGGGPLGLFRVAR